ncbi:MAG: hypothetical protein D6696_01980, partial [Acidobacteria bacterium]
MLIAINYHYVRERFDDPYPGIYGVTPAALRRQLELLGRAGTYVSAEDVRRAAAGGRPLPERALLVTFDDGLREQVELAWPVLQALGIPAIFFVNSRPLVDAVVSTAHQIHLLRAGLPPAELSALLAEVAAELGVAVALDGAADDARRQYPYDEPAAAELKYALNVRLPLDQRRALVEGAFARVFAGRERAISRRLYLSPAQ